MFLLGFYFCSVSDIHSIKETLLRVLGTKIILLYMRCVCVDRKAGFLEDSTSVLRIKYGKAQKTDPQTY
jgi:hypothetical protein